jgi:hypothetical protein
MIYHKTVTFLHTPEEIFLRYIYYVISMGKQKLIDFLIMSRPAVRLAPTGNGNNELDIRVYRFQPENGHGS